MRITFILCGFILLFSSCSKSSERSVISDSDPLYRLGNWLKETIDSSTVFSDSLLNKKIRELNDEIGFSYEMFKVLRVDSASYEILAIPENSQSTRSHIILLRKIVSIFLKQNQ
jgi:hypothetical protein